MKNKSLFAMSDKELHETFLRMSVMPDILAEARVKVGPIELVVLVLESPEIGERVVLASVEHGDDEGVRYIVEAMRECDELQLRRPGEEFHVRLLRIEGGRGIEIDVRDKRWQAA